CQIFKAGNSSCRLLMGSAIAEVAERSPSLQSRCAASFDHLVCARVQRWRHVEAERPGGLEIDHEVEPGRIDDRHVSWLFALENPARINAGLAISVRNAGSVAHETASGDELTIMIECRNGVAFRQRDQLLAPHIKERIGGDNKRSSSPLCRSRKGRINLGFTA